MSETALYATAVGKKYAMAVSGIVLMGYVLAHMIANLKLYLAPARWTPTAPGCATSESPCCRARRCCGSPASS
jgi:hypothetical protein